MALPPSGFLSQQDNAKQPMMQVLGADFGVFYGFDADKFRQMRYNKEDNPREYQHFHSRDQN
jgi:hypothetical protein